MQKVVSAHIKDELGIRPTHLWTSPVLRAKETADIVGEVFGLKPQQEAALGEQKIGCESEITQKLQEVPDNSCVMLVSHSPQIVSLASYLANQSLATPPTSSVAILEFANKVEPGLGRFVRLVSYSDISQNEPS